MKKRIVFIVLLFASLLLYANSLFNPFIWDDIPLIVENPYIKSFGNIPKIFTTTLFDANFIKSNYYRPLQGLTYVFDYAVWKENPLGYHLTNIFLHALAGYLIYLILLLLTKRKNLSIIASLFFLVHPVHTEAVTYISGRADLLADVFLLLSFLSFIKLKISREKLNYYLSLIFFALALLSKENAVILPFMLIFYDLSLNHNKLSNKKITYLPFFLILGIFAFLRLTVFNSSPQNIFSFNNDLILKFIYSIKAVSIYLLLFVFPLNLHMERSLTLGPVYDPGAIFSLVLVTFLIFLVIKWRRKEKMISFGLGWFLLAMIPALGIFMPKKDIIMAEHWLYFPSTGLFIVLAVIFDKIFKFNKKIAIAGLIIFLSIYGYLTIKQNFAWRNPESLYKKILTYSPKSFKAHFNLGLVYEQEGKLEEAIKQYNIARQIQPDYFLIHNNLGNLYVTMGKFDLAEKEFIQSLEVKPDYFLTHNNLGNLYALNREFDIAVQAYRESIKLNPNYSESHNNLGSTLIEMGKYDEAGKELKEALRLNPGNAEAYNNLGNMYARQKLYDEAIESYRKAIKLKPGLDKSHFNLGVVYYLKGQIEDAKKEWKKTLQINPRHSGARSNLEQLNK